MCKVIIFSSKCQEFAPEVLCRIKSLTDYLSASTDNLRKWLNLSQIIFLYQLIITPPPRKSARAYPRRHKFSVRDTPSRHWDDFCSGRGGKNREIKRKMCRFWVCLRLISLCNMLINSVLYAISQISRLDTAYFSIP